MTAVTCPTCHSDLPEAELRDGWCETCGKKVPLFVLREAGPEFLPAPVFPVPASAGLPPAAPPAEPLPVPTLADVVMIWSLNFLTPSAIAWGFGLRAGCVVHVLCWVLFAWSCLVLRARRVSPAGAGVVRRVDR